MFVQGKLAHMQTFEANAFRFITSLMGLTWFQ
jgi:hypothetical protein